MTALAGAYDLFHEGMIALSNVESNGIRIDTKYLDGAIAKTEKKITRLQGSLRKDKVFSTWRKEFGPKTKLGSGDQLAHVLFNVMKYPCKKYTASGTPSSDEENLQDIDLDFVRNWRSVERLKKTKSTFLEGIRKEVEADGLLHPVFNLHIPISYRGSCDSPNFQNFPKRNEEIAKIVRRAFIPRKNHVLLEMDFSGIEVAIAACYNRDPVLIDYVKDTSKDMHRDMASELYFLPLNEINKPIRNTAKNGYVFPQFYGSWWRECGVQLWDDIARYNLTTNSGVPLLDHLRKKGITELGDPTKDRPRAGTFLSHVRSVDNSFWGDRFKVYAEWKDQVWREYQVKGHFDFLTGFRCAGYFDRKQVINYRIQGSAFHCLLFVLIKLNKWLVDNRMQSMIVGQIHDSIVADVHEDELDDYIIKAKRLMTFVLPRVWPWIIVPLRVEAEVSENNWYEKTVLEI